VRFAVLLAKMMLIRCKARHLRTCRTGLEGKAVLGWKFETIKKLCLEIFKVQGCAHLKNIIGLAGYKQQLSWLSKK